MNRKRKRLTKHSYSSHRENLLVISLSPRHGRWVYKMLERAADLSYRFPAYHRPSWPSSCSIRVCQPSKPRFGTLPSILSASQFIQSTFVPPYNSPCFVLAANHLTMFFHIIRWMPSFIPPSSSNISGCESPSAAASRTTVEARQRVEKIFSLVDPSPPYFSTKARDRTSGIEMRSTFSVGSFVVGDSERD